jgi:hypothetical protein
MRAKYLFDELPADARALLGSAVYRQSGKGHPAGWIIKRARGYHALNERRLVTGGYLTETGLKVRELVVNDLESHPTAAAA